MILRQDRITVNGVEIEYRYPEYEQVTEVPPAEVLRIINLHFKNNAKHDAFMMNSTKSNKEFYLRNKE